MNIKSLLFMPGKLDYINQHFTIFKQMLEGNQADNQHQINDFKKQLLQCKVKTE